MEIPGPSDVRPRSAEELLAALHAKFAANFKDGRSHHYLSNSAQQEAKTLSMASATLRSEAGNVPHQQELANYLDEIFGDSVCAVYLASCGLNIPARMLLRRCLELGLVVASYWDSPADFWQWREHDGDVRFATLCTYLKSDGYKSFLGKLNPPKLIDLSRTFSDLPFLYTELSNVVHPKPYNFSTLGAAGYTFDEDEFKKTLRLASSVHSVVATLLIARFPVLESTLQAIAQKQPDCI